MFYANTAESQNQSLRDQNLNSNFANKQNSNPLIHSHVKQFDNNFINSKMSIEYKKYSDPEKIYHQEFLVSECTEKKNIDMIKKSIDGKMSNDKISNTV